MIGRLSRWQMEDADKNCMQTHAYKNKIEYVACRRHDTVTRVCFTGVFFKTKSKGREACNVNKKLGHDLWYVSDSEEN